MTIPEQPSIQLHPLSSFDAEVDILLRDDPNRENILDQLMDAFECLLNGADDRLSIKPYGFYGDSFLCDFSQRYSFTYRVSTDRDAAKKPIRRHYYVKHLLVRRRR